MLTLLLLILALVCFLGATFNARVHFNLLGLGLAFLAGALIVPLV